MKTAKYLYNLLLKLYPRGYRNAFGAQMMQTFVDHYTDVETSVGGVTMYFWFVTVIDEINNITRQQLASLTEGNSFTRLTATKLFVSAILLMPLYPLCYAALVSASLLLPHPAVSGLGFLCALAGLVLLSGILSVVVSYLLVGVFLRVLSQRKMGIS